MKKILSVMLGLSIAVGALSLYAGDGTDTTKTKKTTKAKKAKKTDTTSTEKKS